MKILLGLVLLYCTTLSYAQTEIPRAYRIMADAYGIPSVVFFSLTLLESGQSKEGRYLPWPWTLNIDEKGYYFATREAAEITLLRVMAREEAKGNIAKVAVGLGQIYMPAHHDQFSSPLQALDPTINLKYAATLLSGYYRETVAAGKPDWWVAVGRYHSPYNHAQAVRYSGWVYSRCIKVSNQCDRFGRIGKSVAQQ
jgi:hypothetical protein